MLIVTTDSLPGFEIRTLLGQVFGVAVHAGQGAASSASSGTFSLAGDGAGAGLAQTRREALARLGEEAGRLGANAVVGMCFETAALSGGGHEVCAYGTAVQAAQAAYPAPPAQPGHSEPVSLVREQPAYPKTAPQQPAPQPGQPPMVARNLTIGLHGERPR